MAIAKGWPGRAMNDGEELTCQSPTSVSEFLAENIDVRI
jgi:hypothetical protein